MLNTSRGLSVACRLASVRISSIVNTKQPPHYHRPPAASTKASHASSLKTFQAELRSIQLQHNKWESQPQKLRHQNKELNKPQVH